MREAPALASPGDAALVAHDLADAFARDALFDWLSRTDDRRETARRLFFDLIVKSALKSGSRIERPACGGAAALWTSSEAVISLSFIEEIQSLRVGLAVTGWRRFPRLLALRRDMEAHHPLGRPHDYLWFLGVVHAQQGRGVGSWLLRAAAERLDHAGRPAYLETQSERNVALYRRFGFEVISTHRARLDAPLVWSMWREPAPLP
jgi:ribosomal protein S18 acetylase RimI-like enzyme